MNTHHPYRGNGAAAGTLVATLHVETGHRSAPVVEVRATVSPTGNAEYRVIALHPLTPGEWSLVAVLPSRERAVTCAEALAGYLVNLAPPHNSEPLA